MNDLREAIDRMGAHVDSPGGGFDDLHRLGLGKGAGFPFATHQSGGSWNLIGSSFVVAQSIRKRLAHR